MASRRENPALPVDSREDDDLRVAEQAKQSPDHFSELYERYLDPIFLYCARRVGSQQTAEDITASVFERALSRIDAYRGGSFRAWLFRIAYNAVTDHYRRKRNVIRWKPGMSGQDLEPSPEDYAIASEQRARLRQLLNTLTEDQRYVVELRLSGLTGAEIAEVLDRSPDAVKMLQYRTVRTQWMSSRQRRCSPRRRSRPSSSPLSRRARVYPVPRCRPQRQPSCG